MEPWVHLFYHPTLSYILIEDREVNINTVEAQEYLKFKLALIVQDFSIFYNLSIKKSIEMVGFYLEHIMK